MISGPVLHPVGSVVDVATEVHSAALGAPESTPWELGRAKQALAMEAYNKHVQVLRKWSGLLPALERRQSALLRARAEKERAELLAVPRARKPKKQRPPPAAPTPTRPSVPITGRPPAPEKHDRILEFASPAPVGSPAFWESGRRGSVELKKGEEYDVVTDYFLATLHMQHVRVTGLSRLQNRSVYEACQDCNGFGNATVMFHGCRTQANEANIVREGFQVSRCSSGGKDFGTWFAYGAAYSNSGYVYANGSERHIFICMVSDRYVALDNATMRVVGQGCAYPQWLLTYSLPQPAPAPPKPAVMPAQIQLALQPKRPKVPTKVFVVRNGAWVAETPPDGEGSNYRSRRKTAAAGRGRR